MVSNKHWNHCSGEMRTPEQKAEFGIILWEHQNREEFGIILQEHQNLKQFGIISQEHQNRKQSLESFYRKTRIESRVWNHFMGTLGQNCIFCMGIPEQKAIYWNTRKEIDFCMGTKLKSDHAIIVLECQERNMTMYGCNTIPEAHRSL